MADGKDIAWKPIAYCVGTAIAGVVIGAFLIAPAVQKLKAKKKKEGTKATTMKKAA